MAMILKLVINIKVNRVPVKSKAQFRLMQEAMKPGNNTGIPMDVARDFISSTPHGSFPKLSERINPPRVRTGTGSTKKRNVR